MKKVILSELYNFYIDEKIKSTNKLFKLLLIILIPIKYIIILSLFCIGAIWIFSIAGLGFVAELYVNGYGFLSCIIIIFDISLCIYLIITSLYNK